MLDFSRVIFFGIKVAIMQPRKEQPMETTYNNAVIRMKAPTDTEGRKARIEEATIKFLKRAMAQKENKNGKSDSEPRRRPA